MNHTDIEGRVGLMVLILVDVISKENVIIDCCVVVLIRCTLIFFFLYIHVYIYSFRYSYVYIFFLHMYCRITDGVIVCMFKRLQLVDLLVVSLGKL